MSGSNRSPVQGHIARKRFGQNFLVDKGVIDGIVRCIAPRAGETIVEIGPGLGALTTPLLETLEAAKRAGGEAEAARYEPLHVVELDRDLIKRLHSTFGTRLTVHEGDALNFDFASLAHRGGADATAALEAVPSLRVVGNLPYNISSPLLFHLMRVADRVIDQHFMLQDEVVERMVAEPGSKAYSRLSVMLQYRYAMEKLMDVPPGSFDPPPKVNSAIVRMLPHRVVDLPDVDQGVFSSVVTAAFSQRRKMLRNTLSVYRDQIDFDAIGFDLSRRAEDVPVSEYVDVAQRVQAARA
ncbi:16S rRNA (adenine(1518)-N(6)/adenine(1519)-N(6))-dimethyltransferase RsmA [Robbsia sp. KACC 23696]|uniref:16S rRNA (adenine(1518)-N(6)/adenine(1519)-N(6))- dimethyltransferase RsmA n=1 Tax=Robbsia sp. KACC 23696 TaxID=3149231 RepID=UPI00325B6EB1